MANVDASVTKRSYDRSRSQHERASRTLAGGVATAFRAAQTPVPISFERGSGARLWDIDGNEYVDYALAFGPMLLGHSPEPVIAAVEQQLRRGIGYGASHRLEAELAEAVCRTVPSAELCVFSNTGSEAVHAALRIARAATSRRRIIKFRGHYHGWFDPIHVAVSANSDGPGTEGQDPAAAASVTICDWDDVAALESALDDDVAAIIMEPVAVNGGCFTPSLGYLEAVRALATEIGAVLVFDEVITGYRAALGGAQERLNVVPDLTVLGKALGAGLPISAVCGSATVMDVIRSGRMAHVGTFNANPVCASAAHAAITTLERDRDEIYDQLDAAAGELSDAFSTAGAEAGVPLRVNHFGGAAYGFISDRPVEGVDDVKWADAAAYRRLAGLLLDEGVHVIPRGLLYVSTAHSEADLAETRNAVRRAAERLARLDGERPSDPDTSEEDQ
ncbi:MAG TPA: aminotransferase class III-fold pyridoxal phosphate-dependent enzyme [Solirubrobacteraceae bacterium]|nr:aminotransferase class III-fold pyridoxal phosphate-dependent enzyme [Solirubrobacteraceae bacterium]